MPQTNPPLPTPPEFPVSNASYNKIVGKMHKAALASETAKGAIAAVSMLRDHVSGTNTYAKASRRYADALLAALQNAEVADAGFTPVPDDTPFGGPDGVVPVFGAGGMTKAAISKPAIPLKPEPAQAAFTGKTFSNKSNAKRALVKLGLDHMAVEFTPGPDGTVMPVLIADNDFGVGYCAERGIAAKVKA